MADYVTPEQVASALKLRAGSTDPRLPGLCTAVSDWIDWFTGNDVRIPDPVPSLVTEVALAWAVEAYKQPDASFSVLGMFESGPVRIPREPYKRFVEQLAPVTVRYGVA